MSTGGLSVLHHRGNQTKARLPEALCARAAALLDHPDPFVRGMAEWAIANRVLKDNDDGQWGSTWAKWPGESPPDWCKRWLGVNQASMLTMDYVRQAVALGRHASVASLLELTRENLRRARGPVERYRDRIDAGRRTELAESTRKAQAAIARLEQLGQGPRPDLTAARKAYLQARLAIRRIVFAHPEIDFDRVVYVKRHSFRRMNQVPGSSMASSHRPGGGLYIQGSFDPAVQPRSVLGDRLGPGHIQDMDLSFDAGRIVMSYVRQSWWSGGRPEDDTIWLDRGSEPAHLFEVDLADNQIRQITDHPRHGDIEPAYLPDGGFVFASERGQGSTQCASWGSTNPPDLYRCDADGSNLRRLSYNKDEDRYPHVMDNGSIVYMRWDYQERGFGAIHSLWTMRPDGTGADGLFRVHMQAGAGPQTVRDARQIPGSDKLVMIAAGHHEYIEGAVLIGDFRVGVNSIDAMRYVTPHCSPTENGYGDVLPVDEGGVLDAGGLYMTPSPLSETGFLVSYAYGHPNSTGYAAYYIDVWGNKELIHRDKLLSVVYPTPLRKRSRPVVLPDMTDPKAEHATVYVDNVYADMPGIEKGRIRYIRISEQLQWYNERNGAGTVQWRPSANYARAFGYFTEGAVRVIGTVPVAPDGSAYFKVPPEMAIYFQALDEHMLEVRRMRTHVEFQRGEVRGCVGCHETRNNSVAARPGPRLAMKQPPDQPIEPPFGDTTILGYEKLIQPIFDSKCVKCHSGEKPKAQLDLSSTRDPYGFMQGYRSLLGIKKGQMTPLGALQHPIEDIAYPDRKQRGRAAARFFGQFRQNKPIGLLHISNHAAGGEITQPRQFGSGRSPLIHKLLEAGHRKWAPLEDEQWETLVTWIDANAPYYPTYLQRRSLSGRNFKRWQRVKVELYEPFSHDRNVKIHYATEED